MMDMFQFLIGRLKTARSQLESWRTFSFQFLIGRLKTVPEAETCGIAWSFNSS